MTTSRRGLYILYQSEMEPEPRQDGVYTHEIYLDGSQLSDKARINGEVNDETILELLKSAGGLRRLVHSIGVSVHTGNQEVSNVLFSLQNGDGAGGPGSRLSVSLPADGSESLLTLDDYHSFSESDTAGNFTFGFNRPVSLATISMVFYLHDGYAVPELPLEPPVDFGSYSYREMIAKSLLNKGNNHRLKKAIEKVKKGEPVTIAYIGGSITHGAGAAPLHTNCYAYRSYDKFKHSFAPADHGTVTLIKAGLGGTPSELGVVRYERDVLREGAVEPDVVIVEFAVNDADDETQGNCYESLVLKALAADNKPAVILLFSVFYSDWNLQDRLAPVGWHYDLPMVSVKDAVLEEFHRPKDEGCVISKRQFFFDIYHPTNAGHRLMADCLGWLFDVADRSPWDDKDITLDKQPVIGKDYTEIRLLDRLNSGIIASMDTGGFGETDHELQQTEMDDHSYATPAFPNNWMHTAEAGDHVFTMTINAKRLILLFKDSGDRNFGTAKIWVDGILVRTADPLLVQWTHCHAMILFNEQTSDDHKVEIRMAEGHEDKRFTILGFGYVP